MNADQIMEQEDFKKCADFHGHICPGLSIGYRASKAAMEWLKENKSEDEELVAIVETDACSADAVQVLTGCTFGKGNFIYKDHGKQVLNLISRNTGHGVRVAIKPGGFQPSEKHMELIGKVRNETATEQELAEFKAMHAQRSRDVLEQPIEDLFTIKETSVAIPQKARIEPSRTCGQCGEPAMGSKVSEVDGVYVCRDCMCNQ